MELIEFILGLIGGILGLVFGLIGVVLAVVFGVIGYGMKKLDYEAAPLVLALVLGPIMENAVRRSLVISEGDPTVFFTRPISAFFLILGLINLRLIAPPRQPEVDGLGSSPVHQ